MSCRFLAAGDSRPGARDSVIIRPSRSWWHILILAGHVLFWAWAALALFLPQWSVIPVVAAMRPDRVRALRRETVEMFYYGFDNYMKVAFPEDELRPVSCTPLTRDLKNPRNFELNDVLGNYSLTLIDSLSTLAILASAPAEDSGTGPKALRDFQDGVAALVEQYGDGRPGPSGVGRRARGFDLDSKVQVFETVIRGVGGLLSAHLFAIGALPITGYQPLRQEDDLFNPPPIPWPNGFTYDGQLLRLALDLAQRLLPAFYTKTGLPYPRVNLRHGIPFYVNSPLHEDPPAKGTTEGPPEITETCSAGAGSLVLEFTVLSRLTGDPRFEQAAKRAFWAVWYRKSQIGLIGAGVDAEQGHWIGTYSVIGAGADSFFEYALKSHILLSGHALPNQTHPSPLHKDVNWMDPNTLFEPLSDAENSAESFLEAWHHAHAAIKRHLYSEREHPHYDNVNLWTGSLVSHWVDSLGAYYSGLLVLAGEVDEAIETNLLYAAIWTRYAALPERWSLREKTVEGGLGWWPLRPEFIESTYHLYRATKDPWYLYVGEMVLRDITRRCWTPCGWAGLQNVLSGEKSDRMESFFLGETTKYMYLLFDDDHPLNKLDASFVFTTEGHPLILPKPKSARRSRNSPRSSQKALTVYQGEGFTNSCPPRPSITPLSGSVIAARDDIYHPARMVDLHLLTTSKHALDGGQMSGQHMAKSNYTLYPWTLPPELLPSNGTCAKVYQPHEVTLEFASNTQQVLGGSAFNFMLSGQNLERLSTDRIRVLSLSGLKITLQLVEEGEREWRVTKLNGIPLGRDEYVVINRAILGDVSDPRFNLVRDPVIAKLQQLHQVNLLDDTTTEEHPDNLDTLDTASAIDLPQDQSSDSEVPDPANLSALLPDLSSFVKSLFARLSNLTSPSPDPSSNLPLNVVINQTAILPTGIGAAPLPPAASNSPSGAPIPVFGPVPESLFPWKTIYAAGEACAGPLPDSAPRENQVILIRRGGCSFSDKLANIPAFTPSEESLQLVVVVSDDEHEGQSGLVRPLLDEIQHTPGGMPRRHPIAMVMVGGGETVYQQLSVASAIGIQRRYYIESSGVKVKNIIVDDGDGGVDG
ncbi:alpha mannosidase-like protein [Thermochaetoides thermophila DSM 1495]|uniref:alpha-1,2-Mannosidase n=1 Tax=Chaetomium thermophilum (strain DSM 1495 / CBS 144.50 / IMI 039719) TaxID=759272 RepID=G0SCX7_CHATD|nr:alpha mannosidase-like protein [Thermochaetoides thermophila DSM 1495]EGS19248.1 alpha mannosidase-like protein [Thermochaetoides thermophila DSM 1495]